jgi:hypothetical protein
MTKLDSYVYYHINPETQEVFYVGIGKYDRAWCVRKNNRSDAHVEKLEQLYEKGYTLEDIVKIHTKGISKKEALELEYVLIDQHRPVFNKDKNKDHWHTNRKVEKNFCKELKALHEMGYGYQRIAFLSGAEKPKNHVMAIKRMINYV